MKKIIFLILLACLILFGVSKEARAYNDKAVVKTGYFSCPDVGGVAGRYLTSDCVLDLIRSGVGNILFVNLVHRVGMTEGNYQVNAGENINFFHEQSAPVFSGAYGGGGVFYGFLTKNFPIENPTSAITGEMYRKFEAKEVNNHHMLIDSENIHGETLGLWSMTGQWKYLSVFAEDITDKVSIYSSNPNIVECSGFKCKAKWGGQVSLFAAIPNYWVNVISAFRMKAIDTLPEFGWFFGGSGTLMNSGISHVDPDLSLPLQWDITVIGPEPPPPPPPPVIVPDYNGDCKASVISSYSCQAPQGNICETGTPANVELDGNNWKWTCVGSGTGTNESCMTLRACPQKEVNP